MLFWVLALLGGAILAAFAPAAQFALGLVLLTGGGILVSLGHGQPIGPAAADGLILFTCGQVGYGVGIGVLALFKARREAVVAGTRKAPGLSSLLHRPLWK